MYIFIELYNYLYPLCQCADPEFNNRGQSVPREHSQIFMLSFSQSELFSCKINLVFDLCFVSRHVKWSSKTRHNFVDNSSYIGAKRCMDSNNSSN